MSFPYSGNDRFCMSNSPCFFICFFSFIKKKTKTERPPSPKSYGIKALFSWRNTLTYNEQFARLKSHRYNFQIQLIILFLWADNFQVANCFQSIWGSMKVAIWGKAIVYSFTSDKSNSHVKDKFSRGTEPAT